MWNLMETQVSDVWKSLPGLCCVRIDTYGIFERPGALTNLIKTLKTQQKHKIQAKHVLHDFPLRLGIPSYISNCLEEFVAAFRQHEI